MMHVLSVYFNQLTGYTGAHSNTTFIAFLVHAPTADPGSAQYVSAEEAELHGLFEYTMIGAVARKSTGTAMEQLIAKFMHGIRQKFPRIPVIFSPESSIISFTCCLSEWFCQHGALCTYYVTAGRTNPGVQVTQTSKEEWCRITLGVLEHRTLRIASDFVTDENTDPDALLTLLMSELTMIRCFPKEGGGVPLISGKANAEGADFRQG